jgi:hypothetical protein
MPKRKDSAHTFDGTKHLKGTGPWAGFSFEGGCLVTPEGRTVEPHHLTWLSLTANIAREWQKLMDDERAAILDARSKAAQDNVVELRTALRNRRRLRAATRIQRP